MITEDTITQKTTPTGIYLAAETEKGSYGQHYNTSDKNKPNYTRNIREAKLRFMAFYNNFEKGKHLVSGAGFNQIFV